MAVVRRCASRDAKTPPHDSRVAVSGTHSAELSRGQRAAENVGRRPGCGLASSMPAWGTAGSGPSSPSSLFQSGSPVFFLGLGRPGVSETGVRECRFWTILDRGRDTNCGSREGYQSAGRECQNPKSKMPEMPRCCGGNRGICRGDVMPGWGAVGCRAVVLWYWRRMGHGSPAAAQVQGGLSRPFCTSERLMRSVFGVQPILIDAARHPGRAAPFTIHRSPCPVDFPIDCSRLRGRCGWGWRSRPSRD